MPEFAAGVMWVLSIVFLWLPCTSAYPAYVDCDTDAKTILKLSETIMDVKVTYSESLTMKATRNTQAAHSYIGGEVLQVEISGFDAGSMALLRASDKSNTTLYTADTGGMFQAQCPSQIFTPQGKTLTGSLKLSLRPGCTNTTDPLELTFVYNTGYGKPVLLSKMYLPSEGKQDPSCHGGPVPTVPPAAQADALYKNLVIVHRSAVIVSWGFLFPLGVSLVRYYPSGSRLKLHRNIQMAGLLVEVIDFTCIFWAHERGTDGTGPSDAHFSGTAGASPSTTHKQRGLAVFICILLQVVLGFLRPKPYPNNFRRRIWVFTHRTIGDGAIVIAWVQIWESVSILTDQATLLTMTIVAFLFMACAMLVAPAFYMLVGSRRDRELENESVASGSLVHASPTPDNEHPRDAHFFGCGYCNQVFAEKRALEVHIRFTHVDMEYCEVLKPMPKRLAEVMNYPAMTEGQPLSEVKQHNTKEDCWVVLNGKIYDLTYFLDTHPGGPDSVLTWAGRDATRPWNFIHQMSWIQRYPNEIKCIGSLAPEPAVEGLPTITENTLHRRGKVTPVNASTASTGLESDLRDSLVPGSARSS